MQRLAVLAALVIAAIACLVFASGGGGAPRASSRTAITRLNLRGAQLDPYDLLNPPPPNNYPSVVAEVNGVAITGDALASRQVVLELGRRQWTGAIADQLRSGLVDQQLKKNEADDPLQDLINDELERQAVVRLGLLPSYEEGVRDARVLQQSSDSTLAKLPQDQKDMAERELQATGLSSPDWGADFKIVNRARESAGLTALRKRECKFWFSTAENALAGTGGRDCSAFLAKERANAAIVYYVRWAD